MPPAYRHHSRATCAAPVWPQRRAAAVRAVAASAPASLTSPRKTRAPSATVAAVAPGASAAAAATTPHHSLPSALSLSMGKPYHRRVWLLSRRIRRMNRWLIARTWPAHFPPPPLRGPRPHHPVRQVPTSARTFAPLTMPQPVNAFRSADARPVRSTADAPTTSFMSASTPRAIRSAQARSSPTPTTAEPARLPVVQLDQNNLPQDSRSRYASGRVPKGFTEGFILESVEIERQGHTVKATTLISDTRLQIRLESALAAHGASSISVFAITTRFRASSAAARHTRPPQWRDLRSGTVVSRMAVFDDLHGWTRCLHRLGVLSRVGDFDYYVPCRGTCWSPARATRKPQEVLTATEQARLAQHAAAIRPC